MARAEERGTAINNELLFFELEWAAVARRAASTTLLADDRARRSAGTTSRRRAATARTCSPSPRSGSSPTSRVTGQQRVGAAVLASSPPRSPSTSTARTVSLEQGLSQLHVARPRGAPRPPPRRSPPALAPGLRTRAFVFNTLLADKSTDDRLRSYPTLDREPQPRQRGERRVGAGAGRRGAVAATTSRSAGTRSRRSCSASTARRLRPHGVGRERPTTSSAGTRRATLVLDAYASFSPELADVAERFFDESWIDAPMRPGQAAGRVLRVHGAVAPPVPAAQLDRAPARRAHARARAGPRPARVPRARAGGLPPDHAAHAGRDRVGVRRDGHLRSAARRHRRSRGAARAAGREPRGSDRHGVPPDRDEPLRGRACTRSGASEGELSVEQLRRAVGRRRRPRCSATRSRSPRATAPGGRTSRTSSGTPGLRVRVRVRPAARAVGVPRSTRSGATTFVPQYLELLRRGGSRSPEELGRDRRRSTSPIPAFWNGGLAIIDEQLDAAEAAAKEAGRL